MPQSTCYLVALVGGEKGAERLHITSVTYYSDPPWSGHFPDHDVVTVWQETAETFEKAIDACYKAYPIVAPRIAKRFPLPRR